jgi:hypothetical protein
MFTACGCPNTADGLKLHLMGMSGPELNVSLFRVRLGLLANRPAKVRRLAAFRGAG